jgi:hypothetical protein
MRTRERSEWSGHKFAGCSKMFMIGGKYVLPKTSGGGISHRRFTTMVQAIGLWDKISPAWEPYRIPKISSD